jgi:glutamine amidotransferase
MNPSKKEISILNYQMGNPGSVKRTVERIGGCAQIIQTPAEILSASKIIIPGVGHFGTAMEILRDKNMIEPLHVMALEKKIPILGICLGMQLMSSFSEEGSSEGLGWFDAKVARFQKANMQHLKIPHIGWNTAIPNGQHSCLHNLGNLPEFYFVHSYHVLPVDPTDICMTTNYGQVFASAISKDNLLGVQFHPEKSHDTGQQLLLNFLRL